MMASSWPARFAVLLVFLATVALAKKSKDDSPASSAYGVDDPLAYLKTLAKLPLAQQEILLLMLGTSLQQKTGSTCNIFGGEAACQRLPSDSSYMQQCPGVDPKVDCIFLAQVSKNVYDSPVDNLYEYLEVNEHMDIKAACPQCFDNIQAMWCALAAPKCGSYKTQVQVALLPTLSAAMEAYADLIKDGPSDDDAKRLAKAMSGAVTEVLEAMSLTSPCREMCQAMVGTCDCGGASNETVGSLLEWVEEQQVQQAQLQGQPPYVDSLNKLLFEKVWDRPFCDLFLPSTTVQPAKFAGKCVVMSPSCTNKERWCDAAPGKADAFRKIQAALVVTMTQTVTGWLSDARNGLLPTPPSTTTGDSLDDLTKKYVDDHAPTSAAGPAAPLPAHGTPVGIIVLFSVSGAVVMGAVAGMVVRNWMRLRRAERGYVELQQSDHFGVLDANTP